jgi:hypothetical protein
LAFIFRRFRCDRVARPSVTDVLLRGFGREILEDIGDLAALGVCEDLVLGVDCQCAVQVFSGGGVVLEFVAGPG